jgi:hypothetical protein
MDIKTKSVAMFTLMLSMSVGLPASAAFIDNFEDGTLNR